MTSRALIPLLIAIYTCCATWHVCICVPFVTKRVSLHNPIHIDFKGWIPLRQNTGNTDAQQTGSAEMAQESRPEVTMLDPSRPHPVDPRLDAHYLTVPVAVETDLEHILSETEINQIKSQVIRNWNKKQDFIASNVEQEKHEFEHKLEPILSKLMPKPEVELDVPEVESKPEMTGNEDKSELNSNETEFHTFVKINENAAKNGTSGGSGSAGSTSASDESLFHAYFAPKDHVPEEGYLRLSKQEFRKLFKDAEILFV